MKTFKIYFNAVAVILIIGLQLTACKKSVTDNTTIPVKGTVQAKLTSPPEVPYPVLNRPAQKLLVDMEIVEKLLDMLRTKGGLN